VSLPVLPDRYRIDGWAQQGAYDPVEFDISAGAIIPVVLRANQ
jgi:hypothetical protein